MKTKLILIVIILGMTSIHFSAQVHEIPYNIFFQGGIINNGHNIGFGCEKEFGNYKNNALNVSLNAHQLNHTIGSIGLIQQEKSLFLDFGYKRYLFAKNLNNWKPYLGAGAICGYQHLSEESSGIFSISERNNFLYGANLNIGTEYKIGRFSPFIQVAYIYAQDNYLRANFGLKYQL